MSIKSWSRPSGAIRDIGRRMFVFAAPKGAWSRRALAAAGMAVGAMNPAAGAPLIDLISHNGFAQCWSDAMTTDAFLLLLASGTEGADGCIPATLDGSLCAGSTCNNGSPGCNVTLRAGQYSVSQIATADGYAQFNASNGVDPFSVPVVLPIIGACTVNFVDTTNVAISYPLVEYLQADGNSGFYLFQTYLGSATVSGLTSGDVSLTGGIGCSAANPGMGYYESVLANAVASDALAASTVGQSLCPLP